MRAQVNKITYLDPVLPGFYYFEIKEVYLGFS
nr:MAG TPA_asm: hypothetical protein [Caudoviricetes sp.]DAT96045.1 MAG TPA: hypothetical protein [Caudoviricetes sp.]DAZ32440.1 MAG TPA: hypothetical protein [Caudoviricetes sp.]